MKILFLLCTLTGLGWLGVDARPGAAPDPFATSAECTPLDCDTTGCEVETTCTPEGTCIVTCRDDTGRTCVFEVDCAVDCAPSGPQACTPTDCPLPCAEAR